VSAALPRACPPSLTLLAIAAIAGCAGQGVLERPPDGAYRVPGLAADPMPVASEEGVQRYALRLAGGRVDYAVDVSAKGGLVRVRTEVRNAGRDPVRYRLHALALQAGGAPLARRGLDESASAPPAPEERRSDAYREGARTVAPGERLMLERRFAPPAGDAGRLTLIDEVEAGGFTEPVRLDLLRAQ
jgi:hypothetical protein